MNVDVPDSVAAGDIIVVTAFVDTAGATVTGLATDFAQAPESPVSGENHSLYVMWKRATGADSTAATYDFTLSTSTYRNAQAIRYTGAISSGDPWDVTNTASSGSSNVSATPAVSDTTTVADTLLVWAATNWSGGSWTPPTDFTERRDSGDGVCTVADKAQAAAGATGSISGTSTSTDKSVAWLGALKTSGAVFPVVEAVNESAVTSAGTSHTVTLPAGIAAGDLIVILLDKGSTAATFNTHADYTEVVDENTGNGLTVWVRKATGGESNPTFTSSASTRSAHISYRISGAEDPATQLPELSTVATGSSTSPNATTCTPTGGAKDYLWITFFGRAGEEADDDTWVTGTPANYGSTLQKACGTVGTNLGGIIAAAHRTNNAASEDAGAFTIATGAWRAYTLAVHPASAGTDASAGNASGAATANQPAVSIRVPAGLASAGATANAATVSTAVATNAPAGLAAASATANLAATAVTSRPVAPAAAATAPAAVGALATRPPAPEAVATALQPTVQSGAFAFAAAGLAAASASATAPTIRIATTAGFGSATATTPQPAALVRPNPGTATAAASGSGATVLTGAVAFAGLATATSTAASATVPLNVLAGVAVGAAEAPQAVGMGELPVEPISDPLGLTAVNEPHYLGTIDSPHMLEALED